MNYILIGNGVAGTEAALAIRNADDQGDITILTQSAHHFYYRPRLIEYLAGKADLAAFTLYNEDHYREKRIGVRLNTRVTAIDPEQGQVTDAAGNLYPYDRLLVATGADCFVPPIPGADLPGVFTVRGVTDCDRVREHARQAENAVVIGGGLLGLEAAHSLVRLGIKVTVVEVMDRLLPRQLDAEGASLLQKMLERKGMAFRLGTTVEKISGTRSVTGLVLQGGETIPAGMVVISAGIRGRTTLAREAGLQVNKGIVVDDRLQTSVPGIFAAGDPIEHRDRLYGQWPAAREQGMKAGQIMSGKDTVYTGTAPAATLKVTGIDVYSAGEYDSRVGMVEVSREELVYKKYIIRDNKLAGAIVVGDPAVIPTVRKVFQGSLPIREIMKVPHTKGGDMDKWECSACGYVYDPEKGDDVGGVAPGTAFEDLPDDWVCPVCGVGKDQFNKV